MSERPQELLPEAVTDPSFFDEDYYKSGPQTGKSNYENYRFQPDLTLPMCIYIKRYLGIRDGEAVLDYGCALGFIVKALRMLCVDAYGFDVSQWAIQNCDPAVADYVSNELKVEPMSYDFVIAKDVMEHLTKDQLSEVLPKLMAATRKAMLIIVPLTREDGGPYLCPKDEKDPTHKIRWNLTSWLNFLESVDRRICVSGAFYLPEVKQVNTAWPNSCGFFVLRRF
jgi:hypothetical protein